MRGALSIAVCARQRGVTHLVVPKDNAAEAAVVGEGSSLLAHRPFRSPHHTISDAGLIGGGGTPRPGEVSLANHGVLFLDELPEFPRNFLELLRRKVDLLLVAREPLVRSGVSIASVQFFPQIDRILTATEILPAERRSPNLVCKIHGDDKSRGLRSSRS